jgi:hypothetical protein
MMLGGSALMALGAGVIALSSVSRSEHRRWEEAAEREAGRYGVDPAYTRARTAGREATVARHRRTWVDWLVVGAATAALIGFAAAAEAPRIALRWQWAAALAVVTLGALAACGVALWRTTRFS